MQSAMEEQAAAERQKTGPVTRAEGEKSAAVLEAEGRLEASRKDAEARWFWPKPIVKAIQKVTEAIQNNELPVMFCWAKNMWKR